MVPQHNERQIAQDVHAGGCTGSRMRRLGGGLSCPTCVEIVLKGAGRLPEIVRHPEQTTSLGHVERLGKTLGKLGNALQMVSQTLAPLVGLTFLRGVRAQVSDGTICGRTEGLRHSNEGLRVYSITDPRQSCCRYGSASLVSTATYRTPSSRRASRTLGRFQSHSTRMKKPGSVDEWSLPSASVRTGSYAPSRRR